MSPRSLLQSQISASRTGSVLLPSFASKIIRLEWVGTQWTVETNKWAYVHGGLTLKPSHINSWKGWDVFVCQVLKLGRIYSPHLFSGFAFQGWISTAHAKADYKYIRKPGRVSFFPYTTAAKCILECSGHWKSKAPGLWVGRCGL